MHTSTELFAINGVSFSGYGLLIGVAIVTGLIFSDSVRRSLNIKSKEFWLIFILTGIGFIVGGKLLFVLATYDLSLSSISNHFFSSVGFSTTGGVFCAGVLFIFFTALFNFIKPVKVLFWLDFGALVLPLVCSITRIACIVYGCCGGIFTPELFHPFLNVYPLAEIYFASDIIFFLVSNRARGRKTYLGSGKLVIAYLLFFSFTRAILFPLRDLYITEIGYLMTYFIFFCCFSIAIFLFWRRRSLIEAL